MEAREQYSESLVTPTVVFDNTDLSRSNLSHNLSVTSISVFNTLICLLVHTFNKQHNRYNLQRTLHFTYIQDKLFSTDCAHLYQRVYTPQGPTDALDFALFELCSAVVAILLRE